MNNIEKKLIASTDTSITFKLSNIEIKDFLIMAFGDEKGFQKYNEYLNRQRKKILNNNLKKLK